MTIKVTFLSVIPRLLFAPHVYIPESDKLAVEKASDDPVIEYCIELKSVRYVPVLADEDPCVWLTFLQYAVTVGFDWKTQLNCIGCEAFTSTGPDGASNINGISTAKKTRSVHITDT